MERWHVRAKDKESVAGWRYNQFLKTVSRHVPLNSQDEGTRSCKSLPLGDTISSLCMMDMLLETPESIDYVKQILIRRNEKVISAREFLN